MMVVRVARRDRCRAVSQTISALEHSASRSLFGQRSWQMPDAVGQAASAWPQRAAYAGNPAPWPLLSGPGQFVAGSSGCPDSWRERADPNILERPWGCPVEVRGFSGHAVL